MVQLLVWILAGVEGRAELPEKTGATRATSRHAQMATFCLQGWKEGRDRLRCGVFTARGRHFSRGSGGYPDLDAPLEVFCAFDYDRNLFRYDAQKRVRMSTGDPVVAAKRARAGRGFDDRDVTERFARGPRQSITWCSINAHRVGLFAPSFSPRVKITADLDVRIVGLALWHSVISGVRYADVGELLTKWDIEQVADEGDARYRCVWIHLDNRVKEETRRIVWFDEGQGFAPVRSELRVARRATAQFAATEFVEQESEATWSQINGVWVPRTFSIRPFRRPTEGHGFRERLDLTFDWSSVNERVDDQLFELASMGLPPDARITDMRLGTPVVLGRVAELQTAPPATPHFRMRWLVPIVSMVLLAGSAVFLMLRRALSARKAGQADTLKG